MMAIMMPTSTFVQCHGCMPVPSSCSVSFPLTCEKCYVRFAFRQFFFRSYCFDLGIINYQMLRRWLLGGGKKRQRRHTLRGLAWPRWGR